MIVGMEFEIDRASTMPPYAQLVDQVTEAIDTGVLAIGERLPTVRDLAGSLDLAPNTVARAYKELEAAGLLRAAGRAGTFVSDSALSATDTATARALAETFLDEMLRLGYAPSAASSLVDRLARQR